MAKQPKAVSGALKAAKPAVAVAAGNIVGTQLTNMIVPRLLGSQSPQVQAIAAALIPTLLGGFVFASSKKETVQGFAIGHVLTGVENTLKFAMPGGLGLSGARRGLGSPRARPLPALPRITPPGGGLLGPASRGLGTFQSDGFTPEAADQIFV